MPTVAPAMQKSHLRTLRPPLIILELYFLAAVAILYDGLAR